MTAAKRPRNPMATKAGMMWGMWRRTNSMALRSAPRVDQRRETQVAQRPAHQDAADENQAVLGEVHGGVAFGEVVDPGREQQDLEHEATGTECQRTARRHQREQAWRSHACIVRRRRPRGSMPSWAP